MENNLNENNEVTNTEVTQTPIEETPVTPVTNEVSASAPEAPIASEEAPITEEVTPVAPTTPEVVSASPVTPVAPMPAEQPATPVAPQVVPAQSAVMAPEPKKSNLTFIIIVAILSLLIVVVGVIIVVKVLGNNSKGSVYNNTTTTEIEFTTKEFTTNTVNSTTTKTFTTKESYTQTTRQTKSPDSPNPVKESGNQVTIDGYVFTFSDDFEAYTTKDDEKGIYDKVDNMILTFKMIGRTTVQEQITNINNLIPKYEGYGYQIIDARSGTISGINVAYISLYDGQYYYHEIFMDNQYGDLVDCLTMSTTQYTADSVTKIVYALVKQSKKTGTASAAIGTEDHRLENFDERLLKTE